MKFSSQRECAAMSRARPLSRFTSCENAGHGRSWRLFTHKTFTLLLTGEVEALCSAGEDACH